MATDTTSNSYMESQANDDQSSESDLHMFLRRISLQEKYSVFIENGLKEVEHLQDVEESDITQLSLTVFQFRRL